MAKILFITLSYPGCLHVNMAVAHAMSRRGHEIAFYTNEPGRARVEASGFTCFSFDPALQAGFDHMVVSDDVMGGTIGRMLRFRQYMRRAFVDPIPRQVAGLEAVLRDWPADLVSCDPGIWGSFLILAEKRPDLPMILLSYIAGSTVPGPDAPPLGLGMAPPQNWRSRLAAWAGTVVLNWYMSDVRRAAGKMRQQYGLPPFHGPVIQLAHDLPLFIIPSCPEFDYNRGDLPASVHYVGPLSWFPPVAPPAWLARLPRDRPWIHVTEASEAGQDPVLIRAVIIALADLPVQVIFTTVGTRQPTEMDLGPLPPNVVGADWINYSDLLPLVDMVVCTGGSGTILASLQQGVLVIAIPTWDHGDNAQRLVQVGAGIRLDSARFTPADVRQAVQRILDDPSYRENARRMSSYLSRRGGAARAADLIEGVLADRQTV